MRIIIIFLFVTIFVSTFIFPMANAAHVDSSMRLLKSMFGKIPDYQKIQYYHRFIDTNPYSGIVGGWNHRSKWGHDLESLEITLKTEIPGLNETQKKLMWADHILRDSQTKAGIPVETVRRARQIIAEEYFLRSMKFTLKYSAIFAIMDFLYQTFIEGVDLKVSLINVGIKSSISLATTLMVNYFASRALPYLYSTAVARFFTPGIFMAVDLIIRSIQTGSFTRAFFSWETLFSTGLSTLSLISPYIWISATAAFFIYDLWQGHVTRKKREIFQERTRENLIKQAELAIMEANF